LISLVILPETSNFSGSYQNIFRKSYYQTGWVVAGLIFTTTGIVVSLAILIGSITRKLNLPFLIV
jgi:hypothetical protein